MKGNKLIKMAVVAIPLIIVAISVIAFGSGGSDSAFVGTNLYVTYALIAVITVLVFGFSTKEIIGNKKALIRIGGGIAALALVFIISYSMADGDTTKINPMVKTSESELKFVGAITQSTVILMIVGAVALAFFEVKKALKNG